MAAKDDDPLGTVELRRNYFNAHSFHIFGGTWGIRGPSGRLAAVGDARDEAEFFDRFCAWLDSPEADLPRREDGMG